MSIFYVVDAPELPTSWTHFYTTRKFAEGWRQIGYNVKIAKSLDDMSDGSVILLSNHGIEHNFWALEKLAKNYPNSIYIGWFFNEIYYKVPFKKFILTGEHWRNPRSELLQYHAEFDKLAKSINNYVPLTFMSSMPLEMVGSHGRAEQIDGSFVGTQYKREWIENLSNIVYITSNNVNEEDRIKIFQTSKIVFGFHSDGNIQNGTVTERVFEAMAYGCVVISDNPQAGVVTEGLVKVATSKEEFLNIYHKLLSDSDERENIRMKSYEWIRRNGLYFHVALKFIKKMEELGYIN